MSRSQNSEHPCTSSDVCTTPGAETEWYTPGEVYAGELFAGVRSPAELQPAIIARSWQIRSDMRDCYNLANSSHASSLGALHTSIARRDSRLFFRATVVGDVRSRQFALPGRSATRLKATSNQRRGAPATRSMMPVYLPSAARSTPALVAPLEMCGIIIVVV